MSTPRERLLALALYEIRLLLSHRLGDLESDDPAGAVAAHLAYALHNRALETLDGHDFDIQQAIASVEHIDTLFGSQGCRRLAEQMRAATAGAESTAPPDINRVNKHHD